MKRLALALALLAGACTVVGPDYQRPAQDLPADYPEVPARRASALRACADAINSLSVESL